MLLKIQLRKISLSVILFKPSLTWSPRSIIESNGPVHKPFHRLPWELKAYLSRAQLLADLLNFDQVYSSLLKENTHQQMRKVG